MPTLTTENISHHCCAYVDGATFVRNKFGVGMKLEPWSEQNFVTHRVNVSTRSMTNPLPR